MNNLRTLVRTGVTIVIIALLGWYTWKQTIAQPQYTIGLVYCPSFPFHESINTTLIQKLKADGRFKIQTFAVPTVNDMVIVNSIGGSALESTADAIVSTGISCSQAVTQLSRKRNSLKPIVFVGVSDPVSCGIISSLENPGENITGISSSLPYDDNFNAANLLMVVKPNTRHVLLPYIATDNESMAKNIKTTLASYSVATTLLPVNNETEALMRITGKLLGHDTLMYLEDDGLAAQGPAMGKLASQHNVTMFAGSIDGVENAALSYVANPASLGNHAFDLIKQVFLDRKNRSTIPVQYAVIKRNLIINTALCKEQGLKDIKLSLTPILAHIRSDERFALMHDNIIVK
ncbi:MAG: putative tryptophan/tyrosine transport system substrate-binding protein [Candidatus Dependentiae bacterium]|nr:putative tryptophan/tyrosine transport system substrate-binding protein [Candidatus Dependentiae bacterium]